MQYDVHHSVDALLATVTAIAHQPIVGTVAAKLPITRIAAPVVTGALIQGIPGATGYEIGFALCGGLMVIGGMLGFRLIDPARSVKSIRPIVSGAVS